MDLLVKLANKVNFTYDLHLVEDGNFGSLQRVNKHNHSFLSLHFNKRIHEEFPNFF
jgi:Ligated ion channel L-glutamate- and glycine-binding site.